MRTVFTIGSMQTVIWLKTILPVCTENWHQQLHLQTCFQKEHGQTLPEEGRTAVCPADWEGWVPSEKACPETEKNNEKKKFQWETL